MYLDHFGLREAPFRITPHTEFFFAGANRGATLEALIYAITQDEGIVKVSGEVGSGKTMLCRMLLEKLPVNVETVYLANPSLSRQEILHAIAAELRTPLPDDQTQLLQKALQEKLIAIHATGRLVVVLIDEAHAMPPETLEEIRLLSNLETSRHKLLHIALFGQPELDERLDQSNLRQLKERITHNFGLEPLLRSDIGSYLMFRLRAAGYKGPDLFTAGALQLIAGASEGLTRRVNILADKALLAAFSESTHQIDRPQVKAAIRDAQFKPMHDGRGNRRAWLLAGAAVAAVGIAVLAYFAGAHRSAATVGETTSFVASVPTAPASLPVAVEAPRVKLAAVATSTQVAETPLPQHLAEPASEPSDSASPSVVVNDESPPAESAAAEPANPGDTTPPTFAQRLAASEAWLATTPGSHYFIQLLSTAGGNDGDVELFLASKTADLKLDPQRVRAYRSSLSGRERLGVIYGDFVSRDAANAELARILRIHPDSKAYIRTVDKLR